MRRSMALLLALSCFLVAGCATPTEPVHMYEGAHRPLDQLARLYCATNSLSIPRKDTVFVACARDVYLLPGEHIIEFNCSDTDPFVLEIRMVAKMGGSYRANMEDLGRSIRFWIDDDTTGKTVGETFYRGVNSKQEDP